MVFASHFYLNLVNKQKHLLYFSNGLEYNTQKIPSQNYFQYNFTLYNNQIVIKKTELSYLIKNIETLVNLTTIGYDYTLPQNFTAGINIREQLVLLRDSYFFKTGGRSDELIRLGFKLRKKI